MNKGLARVYGSGPCHDEGGDYHAKIVTYPSWYDEAKMRCAGCHDDFYNGRVNCGGIAHCLMLKEEFGRRNTRPECWHS